MSRTDKRRIVGGVIVLAAVVAIAGASGAFGSGDAVDVPTTAAVKGEFIDYMRVRGEVKAVRSIPITAPSSAGELQILELAKNGTNVKKGDVVVRFDPVPVQRTHAEKQSELKQAEEEIGKTEAQYRIQEQQAQTDLLKARYDVQRAELDAVAHEFLPRLEAEQKKVALASAKERLREAERKFKALKDVASAEIASKRQKRDKARLDVQQAERQLGALQLVTPVDGVVTIMPNWRSCCPPPEFKAGDRAWPGQVIADVPDLATLRVTARLEEAERGRMQPGQAVIVRADAVPDRELTGKIGDISTLARIDFSNWPPPAQFRPHRPIGPDRSTAAPRDDHDGQCCGRSRTGCRVDSGSSGVRKRWAFGGLRRAAARRMGRAPREDCEARPGPARRRRGRQAG